jgi:hypothetical protein
MHFCVILKLANSNYQLPIAFLRISHCNLCNIFITHVIGGKQLLESLLPLLILSSFSFFITLMSIIRDTDSSRVGSYLSFRFIFTPGREDSF